MHTACQPYRTLPRTPKSCRLSLENRRESHTHRCPKAPSQTNPAHSQASGLLTRCKSSQQHFYFKTNRNITERSARSTEFWRLNKETSRKPLACVRACTCVCTRLWDSEHGTSCISTQIQGELSLSQALGCWGEESEPPLGHGKVLSVVRAVQMLLIFHYLAQHPTQGHGWATHTERTSRCRHSTHTCTDVRHTLGTLVEAQGSAGTVTMATDKLSYTSCTQRRQFIQHTKHTAHTNCIQPRTHTAHPNTHHWESREGCNRSLTWATVPCTRAAAPPAPRSSAPHSPHLGHQRRWAGRTLAPTLGANPRTEGSEQQLQLGGQAPSVRTAGNAGAKGRGGGGAWRRPRRSPAPSRLARPPLGEKGELRVLEEVTGFRSQRPGLGPGTQGLHPDPLTSTFPWPRFPPLYWGRGLKWGVQLSSSDILWGGDGYGDGGLIINAISSASTVCQAS